MTYQDYIRACLLQEYNTLSSNVTGEKILDFADIEAGWHFGEGIPVSQKAIRDAFRLHDILIEYGFYETDAFPGLAGEVRVTAYLKDHYFEFTRERDGKWSFIEEVGTFEREESERHSLTFSSVEKIVEEIAQTIWNTFATSHEGIGTQEKTDSRVWLSSLQKTGESQSSRRIAPCCNEPSANIFDFIIRNPGNPQFSGNFPMQFYQMEPQSSQHLLAATQTMDVIEKFSGFPTESQSVYLRPAVGRTLNQGMLKYAQGTISDPSLAQTFRFNAQSMGQEQTASPHSVLRVLSTALV